MMVASSAWPTKAVIHLALPPGDDLQTDWLVDKEAIFFEKERREKSTTNRCVCNKATDRLKRRRIKPYEHCAIQSNSIAWDKVDVNTYFFTFKGF